MKTSLSSTPIVLSLPELFYMDGWTKKLAAADLPLSGKMASSSPVLIEDASGLANIILVNYRWSITHANGYLAQLLAASRPHTQFVILCPVAKAPGGTQLENLRRIVAPYLPSRKITIIEGGFNIAWIRDWMIPLRQEEGYHFAYGLREDNLQVAALIQLLSRYLPAILPPGPPEPYQVDYGDVTANGSHFFISRATVAKKAKMADRPAHRVIAYLENRFQKEAILVGSEALASDDDNAAYVIPWRHHDSYLTPTGRDTVLVGDMDLFETLLLAIPEEKRRSYLQDMVSCLTKRSLKPESPVRTILEKILFGKFTQFEAQVRSILDEKRRALDETATSLSKRFNVKRLPWWSYLFRMKPPYGAIGVPCFSYNNVLMETDGSCRHVFMPTFRLPEIDQYAAAVYQSVGFHQVSGIELLQESGFKGGLRCLTQKLT